MSAPKPAQKQGKASTNMLSNFDNMDTSQATENKESGSTSLVPDSALTDFLTRHAIKPGAWYVGLKADLRVIMRPGHDLRDRVQAAHYWFSRGYRSELAIKQVSGGGFVAVGPSAITAVLLEVEIESFTAAHGHPPKKDEVERMKKRISGSPLRRANQELEQDDGILTAVTFPPANAPTLITDRLSFEEAEARKLITPIRELSKTQRRKLANLSFFYVHTRPRAPSIAALTRRTMDDFTGTTRNGKALGIELGKPAQLLLKLLPDLDPKVAMQLASRGDVPFAARRKAEEALREAEAEIKAVCLRLVERLKADGELPPVPVQREMFGPQLASQSSAVLNPNGTEVSADSAEGSKQPPSARTAEPSSVGGRGVAAPALNDCAPETTPNINQFPPARVVSSGGDSKPVVSSPRSPAGNGDSGRPFVAAPDEARMSDAVFKHNLTALFIQGNKPHPTPGQVRKVMEALPDHALARGAYLDDLERSMPRIQHPGVLDSHTLGFVAAWPAKLDKLEAERAQAAVTLPGMRPMPRKEAIAYLQKHARGDDPDARRWAQEQLAAVNGKAEVA